MKKDANAPQGLLFLDSPGQLDDLFLLQQGDTYQNLSYLFHTAGLPYLLSLFHDAISMLQSSLYYQVS